jgi:hypothetical protein
LRLCSQKANNFLEGLSIEAIDKLPNSGSELYDHQRYEPISVMKNPGQTATPANALCFDAATRG